MDEGVNRQGETMGFAGARVDVAEGDPLAVEDFDAVVGQGDAMDVARQVLGGVVAVAGVLEVDGPGLAEDPRIEPGEPFCPTHLAPGLCPNPLLWLAGASVLR